MPKPGEQEKETEGLEGAFGPSNMFDTFNVEELAEQEEDDMENDFPDYSKGPEEQKKVEEEEEDEEGI